MRDSYRHVARRRWLRVVAVAAGVALVAAACGGGGGGGGGGQGAQTNIPKDTGKPVEGGSLTYGLEAETLGGWCLPDAQLAAGGIQVRRAIYDTLTVPNDKGEYVPYLAKSVEHNADYTEWTIKLRDGITVPQRRAVQRRRGQAQPRPVPQGRPVRLFVLPTSPTSRSTGPDDRDGHDQGPVGALQLVPLGQPGARRHGGARTAQRRRTAAPGT